MINQLVFARVWSAAMGPIRQDVEEVTGSRPESYFNRRILSQPALGTLHSLAKSAKARVKNGVGKLSCCWCCTTELPVDDLIIESLDKDRFHIADPFHEVDEKVFDGMDSVLRAAFNAAGLIVGRVRAGRPMSPEMIGVCGKAFGLAQILFKLQSWMSNQQYNTRRIDALVADVLGLMQLLQQDILQNAQPQELDDLFVKIAESAFKAGEAAGKFHSALLGAQQELQGVRAQTVTSRSSEGDWRDFAENHVFRDFRYLIEQIALHEDAELSYGVGVQVAGNTVYAHQVLSTFEVPFLARPFQDTAWKIYLFRQEGYGIRPTFWKSFKRWFVGGSIYCQNDVEIKLFRRMLKLSRASGVRPRVLTLQDLKKMDALPRVVTHIANYIWLAWQSCPNRTPKALKGVRAQAIQHFSSLLRGQSGPVIEWVNFICSGLLPEDQDF
nr:hypothetical protein [Tolivirales sp.]